MFVDRSGTWPFVPANSVLELTHAKGAALFTRDGRRILDAAGGAVATSIGHGREEVAEATAAAMKELTFACPPFATPHRVALVERLQQRWLPKTLSRVWFASGGSEAIDGAMRLARKYQYLSGRTEKTKVLYRDISYHRAPI
jgi:adenosylmethionine-8-amino-7-oxononanoate aminotransferase